ncbi:CX3C chemokine receptor 1 [Anolis carolinensis]|uniref:CX3C chemokine receptor 1 n=1 Tax=Anolis carolinensis TaxID=28377 RepID=UPI002F2B23D4
MTEETILMTSTEFDYSQLVSPCDKVDIHITMKVFLCVLYVVVFAIGLTGNFLVVLTILKAGGQRSITDIFLLNLAISDLLFVLSLPFWAFYFIHGWTLGNLLCQIVSSLYSVALFGGMFFITVISIDRYLAIVHATYAMKARTIHRGYITSAAIWTLAVLFAAPHFVFVQESEKQCTSLYPPHLQTLWPVFSYLEMNIIGFLLPVCIMSFCYLGIIKTLFSCKNTRKKRAVKLILTVVIVFLLFWAPYHVLLFLQMLRTYNYFVTCVSLRMLDYIVQVTETIAFSHCCLNPIIYAFASEKLRKFLCHLVLKCFSFIGFCGPCNKYRGTAPTPVPETALTSNHTQNTSDQDTVVFV